MVPFPIQSWLARKSPIHGGFVRWNKKWWIVQLAMRLITKEYQHLERK